MNIVAVIPAYNEAQAISYVVRGLCELRDSNGAPLLNRVIVTNNGSDDATAALAQQAGAYVVTEARRGYGYACMAGIAAAPDADILLFVDGDHSIVYSETAALLAPLFEGADLVIGARVNVERGAMTAPQRFGNALACALSRLIWGIPITDLGPFRAITRHALTRLHMEDMTYGWTVEMQLKAFQQGQQVVEVPVSLRCRIGQSKVSGTVRGVLGAGIGIFSMIGKIWWRSRRQAHIQIVTRFDSKK
jgi:glycosyltransferase involved in cell wall biosynthesis